MLIDSHCHLSYPELGAYSKDTVEMLNSAKKQGIGCFLDVILQPSQIDKALSFSQNIPNVFHAFGVHPCDVEQSKIFLERDQLEDYISSLSAKLVAIGETGLDFYRSNNNKQKQIQSFELHCQLAIELQLPVIVHMRDATIETVSVIKNFANQNLRGVIHCFSEDIRAAEKFLDLGFYISFAGIITFKNATKVQEAAINTPLNKLLIETDSPYLAPVPFRGKSNSPIYLKEIATYLAILRNDTLDNIATETSNNFFNLFNKAVI